MFNIILHCLKTIISLKPLVPIDYVILQNFLTSGYDSEQWLYIDLVVLLPKLTIHMVYCVYTLFPYRLKHNMYTTLGHM